jgi:hypothetical protein
MNKIDNADNMEDPVQNIIGDIVDAVCSKDRSCNFIFLHMPKNIACCYRTDSSYTAFKKEDDADFIPGDPSNEEIMNIIK